MLKLCVCLYVFIGDAYPLNYLGLPDLTKQPQRKIALVVQGFF